MTSFSIYITKLPILPVQIWTTDSKLKIKEGFESVIKIWTGGRQFKLIKFGPRKSGEGKEGWNRQSSGIEEWIYLRLQ